MKRRFVLIAAAVLAATSLLADDGELKVLMIGNSFSASVLHVTPKVAEACGLKVEFVNCNIGGCTLKQHWENVEKASDPEFRPYLAMFGTPDSETAKAVRAVCADGKTNIPQMLDAARWDVVTIQQGSVGSPFADTYQPYADNLIATIRKHAPQAEILIQETWAYLPYHKKLDEWKMTQREMYDRLHENYGALAKKTGFRVIPTGTAVERYRAKLPPFRKLSKAEWDAIEEPNLPDIFGDPCGVPKWRKPYRWEKGFDPGKVQLMIDSTHLNSDGEYLQACVWLSVLCGIDARKIGWTPEGLAPDRAALMRECAHEAVESAASNVVRGSLAPYVERGEIAGVVSVLSDADYNEKWDCLGWADAESKVPMRPDTMFAVFSMTKTFTGCAIMIAVDRGILKMDDRVEKYLPEFRGVENKVTIRDCMCHITGIDGGSTDTIHTSVPLREQARTWALKGECRRKIGEKFVYGNSSIAAAAACLEVASGMPYEQFLRENVLGPLGMKDTTFTPDEDQQRRMVKAYTTEGGPFRPAADRCNGQLKFPVAHRIYPMPSAGLYSTPADMIRFSQMLAHHGEWKGRRIVSRKTFDEVWAVKQTPANIKQPYTVGAWLYGDWFGHEGAMRTDQRANLKTGHSRVFFIQTENKAGKAFFDAKTGWHRACDRFQEMEIPFSDELVKTHENDRRPLRNDNAAQPRKEILASSFGWNPEDATKCLQSAIDSGAAKVVVDRRASEWLVETIRVPSDVELVFADGVVVRAKPGSMAGKTDCLFRVQNASNVVIRGEGRARLAMNRSDYLDPSRYRHSEYRHLLSLRNVSNVTVRNLALEESGGDGVYLLKVRNILLEDLVCRGHNRQGTSLIDGGDIVIRNCVFSETRGALPECGMDIEPARSTFSVGRVLVENCLFCSNNCSGLAINVSHLRENCGAMDVAYRNCRFFDNAQRGIWTIFSGGHGAPVRGRVSFEGCEAWNNRSGPLQVANLETDGVEVRFERCRFDAVGMAKSGSPIVLNNGGVKSDMNNLSFADCTLACPPKTAPVSFGAMTGCGVVPGGVKGVLRIEYTDGTSGSYDFAELERKYVPQPELRRFETGVVDVSKLVAANPDGLPKATVFAGYRGPFTFLQAVPGPGSYPIRFMSKPLGKRRSVAVQVEVFDPAGTPHDAFTVAERDFVYELKTTASAGTIYRFQVKPSGSRVVLSSETPGHGFAATDRIHWLTGKGEDIYFQARPGAGDVRVELTTAPHEPVTAELIAPDGTVADKCVKTDSGVILCGKRAPDAPPEIWRLHVTRFVDDCKIRLGAATTGVYAYDPDMMLVERRFDAQPAGERLFPADVTNVCITSVSSIIDRKSFDKGTNLLVRCGYRLKVMPNVLGPNVAPAAERARLFEEAWLAPDTDLILFARGGKGADEVLPLIDWEKLGSRDMRVVGFSDVSLIVNAMLAKVAGHPYSGPMLTSMSRWNGDSRKWFGEMMNARDMPPLKVRVLKGGAARGCPMGGHVMRMLTLSKTPFMPSAAGRVVFLECTARNSADTVTNALMELRDGGFLKGAAAVVFADFQHSGEERKRLDAFFDEFAKTLPCPVFADFPYGHMDGSRLLDFRREVHISPDGVITWEANGGSGEVPLKMQNIAHRGMWDNCVPQNTVEAIRRAYESGATWVETDFHHTKAGQVVCIHMERELERYTGCKKKIEDLSPEDIATLDLGARDGLGRTYRIPLLAQVLAVVPSNGVLQAEIKGYSSEYADIFDNAVKKAGLSEKNIVVSSFQYDALKDFKARYPQYRTVWLVPLPKDKAFDVRKWIAKAKDAGFEVFCPGCGTTRGVMTRADADAVRAAGLEFRMYGVNSRDDLEQAKALGAAGFTCNFWRDAFAWADEVGGVELVK